MNAHTRIGDVGIGSITTIVLMLYLATHGNIPFLMKADEGAQSEVLAGMVAQVLFVGAVFVLAVPHLRKLQFAIRTALPVLSLCGLAMLSALWSQNPSLTVRRSIMLLAPALFALILYVRYSREQILRMLIIAGGIAAVSSIFVAVFFPEYGFDHTFADGVWQGIFPQKNVCARACVFFMLPAVVMIGRRGTFFASCVFLLLTLVLAKTQSKTGLVFALILIAAMLVFRVIPQLPGREVMLSSIFAITCCAVCAVLLSTHFDQFMSLLGKDSTLTGRTQIWEGVTQAIAKRPSLGYGYSAFWLGMKGESANVVVAARWIVPAAHNGLLDLWLQLGSVGLLLFGLALVWGCKEAFCCLTRVGGVPVEWCAGIMLLTVLYNVDESSLMIPGELLWMMFTLAFVMLRDISAGQRFAARHGVPLVLSAQIERSPRMFTATA